MCDPKVKLLLKRTPRYLSVYVHRIRVLSTFMAVVGRILRRVKCISCDLSGFIIIKIRCRSWPFEVFLLPYLD